MALNIAIKPVPSLEKIPGEVTKVLTSVSTKIEAKLTAWINKAKAKVQAALKPPAGLVGKVTTFQVPGSSETYTLWLAKRDGKLVVMLDGIGDAKALDLEKDLPDGLSQKMRQGIKDAVAQVLKLGADLENLLSGKPPKLKEAAALQAATGDLGKALQALQVALVGAPCNRLLSACFAAGTLLRTPAGLQPIEAVRVGDRVLSRDEHDARGGPDYKRVEEVFERLGRVWHLTTAGRLIRTTGEHPFYEQTRGWVPCRALAPGDRVICKDGTTVAVEEVVDTGAVEAVYNLRVADWHTYFVGGHDWGFAVWAHNTYGAVLKELHVAGAESIARGATGAGQIQAARKNGSGSTKSNPIMVSGAATAAMAFDWRQTTQADAHQDIARPKTANEWKVILRQGQDTFDADLVVNNAQGRNKFGPIVGVGGVIIKSEASVPTYANEAAAINQLKITTGLRDADIAKAILDCARGKSLNSSLGEAGKQAIAVLTHLFALEGARSDAAASAVGMLLKLISDGKTTSDGKVITFELAFKDRPGNAALFPPVAEGAVSAQRRLAQQLGLTPVDTRKLGSIEEGKEMEKRYLQLAQLFADSYRMSMTDTAAMGAAVRAANQAFWA